MEQIALIVERLNQPPFNKNYATLTEIDTKSSIELLDLITEIVIAIDKDQELSLKESTEVRVGSILQFLVLMKFSIPNDQIEDFQAQLLNGDKEILLSILAWLLQRFDHLLKRSYLAKYLLPVDIPADFMSDQLVQEFSQRLKDLQTDFKEVHKSVEQIRSSGSKPAEIKAEIAQLEQEKIQLQNKISRMKKDFRGDEASFQEMLTVTSTLRKEQEEELRIYDRLRMYRQQLDEIDLRLSDATKRLNDMRNSGMQTLSAEQLLSKLQSDVKELNDKRDNYETLLQDRQQHLDKLQNWEGNDRMTTEEDVRIKRDQLHDIEDQISSVQERLDQAIDRNDKLLVFRQASILARKKLTEREDEIEKLLDEKRKLKKLINDKENEINSSNNKSNNKISKNELQKYGAVVREKVEKYKRMREELSNLRNELVNLQRTEQILKNKSTNLEEFMDELEQKRGIQGYRDTQRALVEMTEKAAEVDQMKSATLDQISQMVEQISREFKAKQSQLTPIMTELKACRQEYMDLESTYLERKNNYDKVAVGLELDKQTLEKECDLAQEDCLREETRYHTLTSLISIAKIKYERAEQEKKWQNGEGSLMRDFSSLRDLYSHKVNQQEQLTKQLRKRQKDLKENSGAMSNQKTNFKSLNALLDAKLRSIGLDPANRGTSLGYGDIRVGQTNRTNSSSNAVLSYGDYDGANVMSFE